MSGIGEQLKHARILVVDDDSSLVELLVLTLEEAGYTNVRSTTDPRRVKALHQEHDFHLILLDVNMPHLDGFQVMEQLAEVAGDDYLPVLMLTALLDTETRLRALDEGAKDFVTKPFNHVEVLNRIGNMLEVRLLYDERRLRADTLETEVRERTRELRGEVSERKRAEEKLEEARDSLTETLFERTEALSQEIEERKNSEKVLLLALQQAETSSYAKTRFLANMSHELRTPLNSVIGFSHMLESEAFGSLGSEKNKEYVSNIKDSGSHLLRLIANILDISRIEAGGKELADQRVDLGETIAASVTMMKAQAAGAGITLSMELPDGGSRLRGDPTALKQVLLNLLSNAVKFTPAGGRVLVQVAVDNDGETVVTVADTGVGIAAENIPKVVEPFAQVGDIMTRKHEGVGLGLALAKSLTELHGGTLGIDSEVGSGTTITVRFPPERTLVS